MSPKQTTPQVGVVKSRKLNTDTPPIPMPARPGWRMDMPAYYDEKTKTWFCKFYYTDYTGVRKQKKKRGFKLQREAKEWERAFLEKQQGTPDMTFQALYDI